LTVEVAGTAAVVTGAAAGIGRAAARALVKGGASVVVADVDEEWGREAEAELRSVGGTALFVRADVSSEADVASMIAITEAEFGGLDILVNNAFAGGMPHFPDAPVEQWSRVVEVALRGTMLGIQLALPAMSKRGGGAIVNVSSIAGLGTRPHAYPEYAAVKAAIVRLTECLGPLAEERNVRVNCVAPDWTATEFVRERWDGMAPEERAEARDGFGRPAPERFLEPAEVAAAVMELVQDESLAGRTMVLWCGEEPRLLPSDRWE
jgi:NAD(P)-dependent dehydrogenase (short-subunit alcohol dehydrogenase family)